MLDSNTTSGSSFYDLLGVPHSASTADIKQAFRALARSLHPDKGGDPHVFGQVQHAASVLLDPKQRLVYDQTQQYQPVYPPNTSYDEERTREGESFARTQGQYSSPVQLQDVWDDKIVTPIQLSATDHVPHNPEMDSGNSADAKKDPLSGAGTTPIIAQQSQPVGLQGAMLDLLAAQGVMCDAPTQLVVTCELCHCPATRTCSLCGCNICELCTRTMHSKGQYGLHWPLVNQPGLMAARLAQREFEAKRLEDAQKYEARQPGYMPEAQRVLLRDFQEAAAKAATHPAAQNGMPLTALNSATQCCGVDAVQRRYVPELARHYMWTQTPYMVYIAVHLPEGQPDQSTHAQVDLEPGGVLKVWTPGRDQLERLDHIAQTRAAAPAPDDDDPLLACTPAPTGMLSASTTYTLSASDTPSATMSGGRVGDEAAAVQQLQLYEAARIAAASSNTFFVINRQLAGAVDMGMPMEVMRTECNRFMVVGLAKATTGRTWPSLFVGDGHGVRSVIGTGSPPSTYRLHQDTDEVVMEMDLPSWVTKSDVQCDISTIGVRICVRGFTQLARTFWAPSKGQSGVPQQPMIVPQHSSWVLTAETGVATNHTPASNKPQQATNSSMMKSDGTGNRAVSKHRAPKLLTLLLSKRDLTLEEQQYKRGVRQDNLACTPAAAFFTEDEDEWGLTGLLQQVLKERS